MFIRAELKQKAKENLHRNLWLCIGVTFVFGLLSSDLFGLNVDPTTYEYYFRMGLGTSGDISMDFIYIPITSIVASLVLLASLSFKILIVNPIIVGHTRFYIENKYGKSSFEALFAYFNANDYWNVVKVMLLYDIYIILWTLCFIVPGIIKSYEYYFVPYILAENPNMDSDEIFEITKEMTSGHKFDLFVLELSFILWNLLALITLGLSTLYVNPYMLATKCEAYYFFKQELLNNEIIQEEIMEETAHVEPTIDDLH